VDLWISERGVVEVCEIARVVVAGTEAAASGPAQDEEEPMKPRTIALLAVMALSVAAAAPVRAEVPTAADFAACNTKAAEESAADTASASPRTDLPKDATRLPADAKPKAAGTLSSDKDPQVEGLAADRAGDKVYVAAYRSCMRQRGF